MKTWLAALLLIASFVGCHVEYHKESTKLPATRSGLTEWIAVKESEVASLESELSDAKSVRDMAAKQLERADGFWARDEARGSFRRANSDVDFTAIRLRWAKESLVRAKARLESLPAEEHCQEFWRKTNESPIGDESCPKCGTGEN